MWIRTEVYGSIRVTKIFYRRGPYGEASSGSGPRLLPPPFATLTATLTCSEHLPHDPTGRISFATRRSPTDLA